MTLHFRPGARGSGAPGEWNPLTVALLTGAWLAFLPNWALWRAFARLPENGSIRGALFTAGFGLMIAALLAAILSLAAWRPTIKPAASFLVVAAAIGAHFMASYGVVIDTTMMASTLQSNLQEAGDLLNVRLLIDLAVLGALPLFVITRLRLGRLTVGRQLWRNAAAFVASLTVVGGLAGLLFADLSATMRNHPSVRYLINPLNSLYALVDLGIGAQREARGTIQPIGLDARPIRRPAGDRPLLVLLVVGETARADHFSLNGYPRPTNPELAGLGVVSFTAVTSCGTNTAASLPCMFSARGKRGYEARASDEENLLDLVHRAGYAVLWVDNQAGCKNLCRRVANAFAIDPPPGESADGADGMPEKNAGAPTHPDRRSALCKDGECLDEALLLGLDERIATLPAAERERGLLVVLHQMGSHGPAYFKRSPPGRKPFLPECATSVLQRCDRNSIVNAYDNSLAYTDHVLASAVRWLANRQDRYDVALTYVSDHGESLGGNGIYLHGLPYAVAPKEQTHVPMVVWLPPRTERAAGVSMACLQGRRNAPLSHDNLFHSVVGLLGLQAREYRASLDAFAPCRPP